MLTLEELKLRLERDNEIFERLTAERETVRIRRYRYKRQIDLLEQVDDMTEEDDLY